MKGRAGMELEFWGIRGTVPVSGRPFLKFGGHTACASLMSDSEERLIIDAGTGIRGLGRKLKAEDNRKTLRITLLLTHFHLDHVIGLPFFGPLFSPDAEIVFYSFTEPEETEGNLRRLLSGGLFPVELDQTPSRKIYKKAEAEGFFIGGVKVTTCPLQHPQGSVAYKLETDGRSVVFATDTEHPETGVDERLAAFAYGASYLIYDATFTPEEYESEYRGWGHSTWQAGTKIAQRAGVRKLLLSHFNPDHSDQKIREILRLARKEFPRSDCAREGMRLKI
jgi:phosphoribosyl 1,2-cyclic phosphodiesterase